MFRENIMIEFEYKFYINKENKMPIIIANILEGRNNSKKKKLIENITKSVVDTLDVQPENVRVMINEIKKEHYGIAGLPFYKYKKSKR